MTERKLTMDEFQRQYHAYETTDREKALRDYQEIAPRVEVPLAVVRIVNKYAIMVRTAANLVVAFDRGEGAIEIIR